MAIAASIFTYNGIAIPTKAPNLPIAPVNYTQQYQDQVLNALRLYFAQVDTYTQSSNAPAYGTTAQRPVSNAATNNIIPVGYSYFDTTLGYPVYWSGSAWVKAVPSSASVSSFSAGTTGLTPNTATTGDVVLGGVLSVANGGTGSSSGVASVITGAIQMWPTTSAPSGYLLCNGSAVSRTTYAALYAVISTTFGTGDGSTTFNLPNYTNRMPYGTTIGSTGGSADAALPSHTHTATVTDPGHKHIFGADDQVASQGGYTVYSNFSYDASSSTSGGGVNLFTHDVSNTNNPQSTGVTVSNSTTGVSPTGANLPPYLGINFIIKT
jgi:microcystin-dependent protein